MAKFNSGMFNDVFTVERSTETVDSFGGYTVAWATVATIYGLIETTSGQEALVAGRLEPTEGVVITCHYRSDLLESDRLVIDGAYYGITRIENVDRQARWTRIYADTGVRT